MTGFIYKITNDINEHIYVGKTILTVEERFKEHIKESKKYKSKNRPLYNAMLKYGYEHFTIHIIEECDCSILDAREQFWISYYNSYKNGYNATLGGDGALLYDYDIIIQKYNEGMTFSEICNEIGCERTVIQRALKRTDINPFKNAINKTKIPVVMCDQNNGAILHYFDSCSDAAQWLIDNEYSNANKGTIRTNIGRVINGIRKTCCGFTWQINPNWQGTGLESQQ